MKKKGEDGLPFDAATEPGGAHESGVGGPKRLTSDRDRENARRTRDGQWAFMDKVNTLGTVWWCIWNKARREEAPDEVRHGLIAGMELNEWMASHSDWWTIGEWDDARYARPVGLTDAGRVALANRALYDMEDVTGGLVEPGFIVTPTPPASKPERLLPLPNTGEPPKEEPLV